MSKINCYLRTHRRQWGLSQKELSFLLGLRDRSHVSRLELTTDKPPVKVALGCEILFGFPAKAIFPKLYANIEDSLMRRAFVLHQRLKREDSKLARTKTALLEDALRRAKESHPQL